ncbi:hypothetical protein CSKR_106023 [Clonorchis sinensis]|uniref:Uncharacterized protein n=1 Tax=Clonorchis sinensis TaxID=79923 RepID=A0A419PBU0_CLOSI|nr:hypothetical protein CSKR_106023 [Clonorchis sinensis]
MGDILVAFGVLRDSLLLLSSTVELPDVKMCSFVADVGRIQCIVNLVFYPIVPTVQATIHLMDVCFLELCMSVSFGETRETTASALMMPPRLVMKPQRTNQRPSTLPGLPKFSSIENQFGRTTLKEARHWENLAYQQASTREQLYFLNECLCKNMLPPSTNHRPTPDRP